MMEGILMRKRCSRWIDIYSFAMCGMRFLMLVVQAEIVQWGC